MRFLLVVMTLALVSGTSLAKCSKRMKVGFEHYPPFQVAEGKTIVGGIDFQMIELVSRESGCEFH